MRRLCVFYNKAYKFLGSKKVEWIVCQRCQRDLHKGASLKVAFDAPKQACVEINNEKFEKSLATGPVTDVKVLGARLPIAFDFELMCADCGSSVRWDTKNRVYRHKFADGHDESGKPDSSLFCQKYGYPVNVQFRLVKGATPSDWLSKEFVQILFNSAHEAVYELARHLAFKDLLETHPLAIELIEIAHRMRRTVAAKNAEENAAIKKLADRLEWRAVATDGFEWLQLACLARELRDIVGQREAMFEHVRRGLQQLDISVRNLRPLRCEMPPKGWYCTREPEHDGPCAARPVEIKTPNQVRETDGCTFHSSPDSLEKLDCGCTVTRGNRCRVHNAP